jgi:D-alanine-D-alanine ligase
MPGESIIVLYNEPTLPPEHPDRRAEEDVLRVAADVASILERDYRVSQLGIGQEPDRLMTELRQRRPDAVFNLFEGLGTQGQTEAYVAGLLDWLGIPYTGCPFESLVLCRDKSRTKQLLRGAGLPTAAGFTMTSAADLRIPNRWPQFVKPANQDASVGVDHGSVVQSVEELQARVQLLLDRYGPPILVEDYLGGREFNVGVIACPSLRVLPLAEIEFHARTTDFWPIVTYDSKWLTGSQDDLWSVPKCPAEVDPDLAEKLRDLAASAFVLFGCRDYARVDIRTDEQGQPYILEVNPNPDFHRESGLARALGVAGIEYDCFALDLARQCCLRHA